MLTALNEEARLLKRARELDNHALGEIHDRYYPEIYRYAYSRTGDRIAAEDIAGEVFLRLLNSLHGERPPQTTLRGWLFGVASHLITDHFRSGTTASISEEHPDVLSTPAEAERSLRNAELHAAIRRLKPDQQEVIALRFGGGFSIEETARLMKRSITGIKALQFRAVVALRRLLAEVDEYE